jgi:HMG (high mobility group) box
LDLLGIAEDSLDSHVGSDHLQTSASPAPSSQTPGPLKGRRPKVITGYILYASARRKNVSVCNPDARFGEISRIIGNEWRSMELTERQVYEDRAGKINGANAEKYHLEFPNGAGAYEAPSILQREILPNQV